MPKEKKDEEVLDRLEQEVREEEGIQNVGPEMSTHDAGVLGGHMVRKLVEEGKKRESEK